MDEPIGTTSFVFSAFMDCPFPERDREYCDIPLPLQSPLGIYEGLDYRATGEWPATFLCLRHGHVCARSLDSIHQRAETRGPGQPAPSLWAIECKCGNESCGTLHTIYTARIPTEAEVIRRVLYLNPRVSCGDHVLLWRENLMNVTEFAHKSPVR